jgi:large subunit ribosomal protein L25
MPELVLEAMPRESIKKEACKKYRKEGLIPSIIYGQGKNTNILVKSTMFRKLYPSLTHSTIITLKLDKSNINVLIKGFEKDHIKNEFTHLDFYELDDKKPVKVSIPLEFIGSAIGIREGGLLEKHLVNLTVLCLPKDIVPHFQLNIENLKINESLHVKDVNLDAKYKVISHPDEVIVRISTGLKEEAVDEVKTAEVEGAAATTEGAATGTDKTEKTTEKAGEEKKEK